MLNLIVNEVFPGAPPPAAPSSSPVSAAIVRFLALVVVVVVVKQAMKMSPRLKSFAALSSTTDRRRRRQEWLQQRCSRFRLCSWNQVFPGRGSYSAWVLEWERSNLILGQFGSRFSSEGGGGGGGGGEFRGMENSITSITIILFQLSSPSQNHPPSTDLFKNHVIDPPRPTADPSPLSPSLDPAKSPSSRRSSTPPSPPPSRPT